MTSSPRAGGGGVAGGVAGSVAGGVRGGVAGGVRRVVALGGLRLGRRNSGGASRSLRGRLGPSTQPMERGLAEQQHEAVQSAHAAADEKDAAVAGREEVERVLGEFWTDHGASHAACEHPRDGNAALRLGHAQNHAKPVVLRVRERDANGDASQDEKREKLQFDGHHAAEPACIPKRAATTDGDQGAEDGWKQKLKSAVEKDVAESGSVSRLGLPESDAPARLIALAQLVSTENARAHPIDSTSTGGHQRGWTSESSGDGLEGDDIWTRSTVTPDPYPCGRW